MNCLPQNSNPQFAVTKNPTLYQGSSNKRLFSLWDRFRSVNGKRPAGFRQDYAQLSLQLHALKGFLQKTNSDSGSPKA